MPPYEPTARPLAKTLVQLGEPKLAARVLINALRGQYLLLQGHLIRHVRNKHNLIVDKHKLKHEILMVDIYRAINPPQM